MEGLKFVCVEEEKEVKRLENLQKYLKYGLPRYTDKVEEMPKAPEGIEYRNLGIMESQIFTVLSRRFSNRRMSFSKRGATMLSKVVALKIENNGREILEALEKPIKMDNLVEEWITQIEEQVERTWQEKKIRLKNAPPIKVLNKPYEGVALTEGMKSIRKMCELSLNI